MTGLWVALAAIAVALVIGGFRALTDGRFRGTHAVRGATPGGRAASPSDAPGGRAASPSDAPGGRAASPSDAAGGRAASASDAAGGRAASASDALGGRAASASERVETPEPDTTWARLGPAAASAELGERATLVQFSSAFCAPCRVTRRVLGEVADVVPGVVHVEIDAEHHLDAVRRLGILRTPTTLILDPSGHEIARAAGAPRKEQVLAAIPAGNLR